MNKKYAEYGITAAGLILLGAGLFLVKTQIDPQGILKALPYIMVGLGCGAFGYGAGGLLKRSVIKKYPDIQKQMEIETKDERNAAISNLAKAKAYDIMLFVFAALVLAFALMGLSVTYVLLLVFAYLFLVGCNIYFLSKYEKEM